MVAPKKNSISSGEQPSPKTGDRKSSCCIVKYITILRWLPKYSQFHAVSDLVAGVSLGLTLIPQSIAYAALAGLTAQYGLYSCIVGAFMYIIFGTIKEVSIGPSSLMSLLTLEYTKNMPVDFVVLFCFLAGCVELIMGVLRLGFLVDFISIPVTSGFTSATSIIIIISQLQGLIGLKFKAHNVVDNFIKIFQNLKSVRLPDLTLGLCSILFLLCFRQLKDIDCSGAKDSSQRGRGDRNIILKRILWFLSICRNALLILITATTAFYLERTGESPFILSGRIESGLPKLSLPPFSTQVGNETYTFLDMCSHLGTGIIVLPLVSVLANVAIAKAFASGTVVNATQEMLTLGLCNILGSFFSSMPSTGAFTRSAVLSASGVQTPMAGVYVGIMTLLALSFLTPYFYYIPRATLAAVLISAVIFIIDFKIVKLLWKGSKKDAVAAIVTFLVSVVCGVELGLLTGAIFNLIYLIRPSVRPQIEVTQCKTRAGYKYVMLKPNAGLLYPSANYFCNNVIKIIQQYKGNNVPFIINCERILSIDYTATKGIEMLSRSINSEKNKLWFLNVNLEILECIRTFADEKFFHFLDEEEEISICYDDTLISNREEVKEKLLDSQLSSVTFTHLNNEKKIPETHSEVTINSKDGAEETALTSN